MVEPSIRDLPLRWFTPDSWAPPVLRSPLELLSDHAHLEKKAAANALVLLNRWPEPTPPEHWVQFVTAVAKDEVEHLSVVTRLLARRGGQLQRTHQNTYATDLRRMVRMSEGPLELADRLMVSALIEARSCERFALLAAACEDDELARLYRGLWASEAGHYRVFLSLAEELPAAYRVRERWSDFLDAEARVIRAQPIGPAIHSGVQESDTRATR